MKPLLPSPKPAPRDKAAKLRKAMERRRERNAASTKKYADSVADARREVAATDPGFTLMEPGDGPPPVNRERRERDWPKAYHSEEYVLAVQKMACTIPGCDRREIDAAHGEHTKGAGGSWRTILPLCGGPDGHHAEQHDIGRRTFERKYGISLEAAAAATRKALSHITGED